MDGSQARFSVARWSGPGTDRRRLLVVGDRRPVVGDGARGLAAALVAERDPGGSGVDLDVLSDLAPAMRAIGGGRDSWRLWRYDAVVVLIGSSPAGRRGRRLQRLLLRVSAELATASPLVLAFTTTGSHDPAEQLSRAAALDLLQRLAPTGRGVRALFAPVGPQGELTDPTDSARAILAVTAVDAGPPDPGSARARRDEPQEESGRQRAVERSLGAAGGSGDLLRVLLMARNSFAVPYAQINLVSGGRLRTLAHLGRTSEDLENTLSGLVVQHDGPLLIEDTHADARLAHVDEIRGAEGIRFYAGHPIESLDGYRIGVLCVFDTEPHPLERGDATLLRDVALLAEGEINALTAAAIQSTSRR